MPDAAELLVHEPSMQDPFSYIYPDAQILEEMLLELRKNPKEKKSIESRYREPVIRAFNALIDIFTTPDIPYEQSIQLPISRSTPQDSD